MDIEKGSRELKCDTRVSFLKNEKGRIVDYVWRCNGQFQGVYSSNKTMCSMYNCKGRKPLTLKFEEASQFEISNIVEIEMLKFENGICSALHCEKAPLEGRYCSEECQSITSSIHERLWEKMGRKSLKVSLPCSLCGEDVERPLWKIRQNRTGTFFCCRAHQELYMLKNQGNLEGYRMKELMIEKISKRD